MSKRLDELGERVRVARLKQRWDVKGAAEAAHVARDTWKRIEEGLSVRDTSRAKVLDFLGLDDDGHPAAVGGDTEDADYVAAPGVATDQPVTNEQVLAEVRAMREDVHALSRRVAGLESPPQPLGGTDGPV